MIIKSNDKSTPDGGKSENNKFTVSGDWFTDPKSLEAYKADYLQYITDCMKEGGRVTKFKLTVDSFNSTDCITTHAIAELTDRVYSSAYQLAKRNPSWLTAENTYSKSKITAFIKEDEKRIELSYSYQEAALILGVKASYLENSGKSRYPDLQPLVVLTLSRMCRISKKRLETYLDNEEALLVKDKVTIDGDWFTNPVSLDDYKANYLQYIADRGDKKSSGNVTRKVKMAIDSFTSIDCITAHAFADLAGYTSFAANHIIKRGDDWLDIIGGDNSTPLFSKRSIISTVKVESELYEKSYSQLQVAIKLGLCSANSLNASLTAGRYKELLPMIKLPISKSGRICKQKAEDYIAKRKLADVT